MTHILYLYFIILFPSFEYDSNLDETLTTKIKSIVLNEYINYNFTAFNSSLLDVEKHIENISIPYEIVDRLDNYFLIRAGIPSIPIPRLLILTDNGNSFTKEKVWDLDLYYWDGFNNTYLVYDSETSILYKIYGYYFVDTHVLLNEFLSRKKKKEFYKFIEKGTGINKEYLLNESSLLKTIQVGPKYDNKQN